MEALAPLLNLICLWSFAGILIGAAWTDLTDYTIPNRLIVGLLLLYPAYVLTADHDIDWLMALAISGGLLAFGLVLFSSGHMGGGDVKLIAATALWMGSDFV